MEKSDICYVVAKYKKDYTFDGIVACGIKAVTPYTDFNLVLRLLREIWKKLRIPGISLFYNRKAVDDKVKKFIIYDPLITDKYITWLKKKNPNARIVMQYVNRADTTISPKVLPSFVEKFSYDKLDCEKYNMTLMIPSYFDGYSFDSSSFKKDIDVLYVGRDKGRLGQLLDIEQKMKDIGLRTNFHICANRKYQRFNKRIYQKYLDYDEYLTLLKRSVLSLNVAREDQDAVTLRELECVFDGIKCITTNKNIEKFELYDETRFFVLKDNNYRGIQTFLEKPFKKIDPVVLEKYSFEHSVKKYFLQD